jgi:hypothetical protein
MANEWPANDSTSWDTAISNNLTTGGSHNASTGLHGLGVLSGFSTITFTRDMTAASGDVAYTGVGFEPRQVIFFASVAGTKMASWGVNDALGNGNGQSYGVQRQFDTGEMSYTSNNAIELLDSIEPNSGIQRARIQSFDSDGFTLAWDKNLSPTGTATVIALCLK